MQSRGSYWFKNNLNASWVCTSTTCIWYVQGWNQRSPKKGRIPGADLEGVVPEGGIRNTPPWIIKIYISENNISRFSAWSGGNFVCLFKIFRLPSLTCYHIQLEWKYMYYDPSLPFNDFADCLGNFLVVHRSYTFYTCAEQLLFL